MTTKSTIFTGPDNVGDSEFTVDPFQVGSEAVYLNGLRLTRNIGYTTEVDDPAYSEVHSKIILSSTSYPVGLEDDDDVLEVVVDVMGAYSSDPTLQTILERLDDIAAATYGSWRWTKGDGMMTMYDQFGSERFKFNVRDDAESASRERRQDLEV